MGKRYPPQWRWKMDVMIKYRSRQDMGIHGCQFERAGYCGNVAKLEYVYGIEEMWQCILWNLIQWIWLLMCIMIMSQRLRNCFSIIQCIVMRYVLYPYIIPVEIWIQWANTSSSLCPSVNRGLTPGYSVWHHWYPIMQWLPNFVYVAYLCCLWFHLWWMKGANVT